MTELSRAEQAALAARGWLDRQRERGPHHVIPEGDRLLFSQLDAIYPEEPPRAGGMPTPQSEAAARELFGQPQWVMCTWADVVTGDRVRAPGTNTTALVVRRYRHPSEDPFGQTMHVVPSAETGPWAHKGDRLVQPGECVVELAPEEGEQDAGGTPRYMKPQIPVEIELTAGELSAIEAMADGWSRRWEMKR
jgi:hypothetical protein